ncbi:IPExxxVDY family protein [Algoriphagus aquimarinus]|uniref:IPExxxVDY family protein n=1 Tax=Algoriphagus aquimarinus TaxID=237018 RepID=A0A5C7B3B6_9BACT|nr:IPExxxVDY family protein [Algoriphagus aquimarinus]TXE12342.1 IPExxxVDY family protein [Algoriphagus aquimarinus]|tara:strand:+ start:1258 stop:1686 length:429 start_codon:yes stop_codon:yes gene_type:complete
MKKAKLLIEHTYDFELLGLVSPVKDYKMAWLINRDLDLNLVKFEDLELEFMTLPSLKISQYFLSLPHGFVQLLKNKALNSTNQVSYLIPELKTMDYFLLVQDETFQISINTFATQLAKNRYIQNVMKLDVTKLKSKENLLTY